MYHRYRSVVFFQRACHPRCLLLLSILLPIAGLDDTKAQAPADSASPAVDVRRSDAPWQADPILVEKTSKRRTEFNYTESQIPDYELPDVLVGPNGKVESQKEWLNSLRPWLLNRFRKDIYGIRPDVAANVDFRVLETRSVFDSAAKGYRVRTTIRHQGNEHAFDFTLLVPLVQRPVPILIQINNRYRVTLDDVAEKEDPFWPTRMILDRGYATASFFTSDVDPDKPDGYEEGIRSLLDDPAADVSTRWRALSAWGWTASRILDFAAQHEDLDETKSAVIGHSRGGKAALWAAAEDDRFAIAYSNNSGCGGAALSRRRFGETIERITTVFPHWFTDRFADFGNREHELPVDQHQLIALLAPRAVYVTSSDEDLWADPRGEYTSVVEASAAFRLLGQESIMNKEMPPLDKPRHVGATGYHIRKGKHNLTEIDWRHFLDFAKTRF